MPSDFGCLRKAWCHPIMKQFSRILAVLLLLVCCLNIFTAAEENSLSLTINGNKIDKETYGETIVLEETTSQKIFIPLNAFIDKTNAIAEWNENKSQVTVTINDTCCEFTLDSDIFTKNGAKHTLEVPVTNKTGIVMISSDTLAVAFGARIVPNSSKTGYGIAAESNKPDSDNQAHIPKAPVNTANDGNKDKGKLHEIFTVIGAINIGFVTPFKLFAVTLIGAIPLGLIICLCSMSKIKPIRWLSRTLVWIIRGTPLMLQLLIIYYVPGIAMGGNTPWNGESGKFIAAAIAFIVNYAFYFSEIFRGGIENVPAGQLEAGQVLGMTKTQIFFHVTLMQMVKRIVPPMANEIITLTKDTSIARIISMQEVIWAGYAFLKSSHGYSGLLWPIFFTGVYYLLFTGILTILFSKIEKKLSYFN